LSSLRSGIADYIGGTGTYETVIFVDELARSVH